MTEHDFEQRLRAGFRDAVDKAAPAGLRASIIAIPDGVSPTPQRRLTSGWRFPPINRFAPFALAATAVAVALLIGIGLLVRSSNFGPSPVPGPTHTKAALIAYIRSVDKPNNGSCYSPETTCPTNRLWIVGSDGRGAHELFPDGMGPQSSVTWSPDGTRLIYSDGSKFYVTDPSGSEPQVADTGCVAPCGSDVLGSLAFSSDGTQVVFTRNFTDGSNVIATMDLASGRVTELSSTAPAGGDLPGWSPDGKQIVFSRAGEKDTGGPIAPILAAVLVVDADGQNLRQISPATLAAEFAGWSPDGSWIVFTSPDAQHHDIYTVRPDGTDLRRLTTDGVSMAATWTPDGRILFARGSGDAGSGAPSFWTMDPDGANAAELMSGAVIGAARGDFQWTRPAWQPAGGPSIVPLPWTAAPAT